jgi:hypothetical protein
MTNELTTEATDRSVEWRGGSLDDLVRMLSTPAVAARIEVLVPDGMGRPERPIGEVHMVAGGVSDAFAGTLRGDEAMAHLKALAATTFRVEPCIPEPASGGIAPAGPSDGSLAERSLAALMRYCEQYVMTCLIEVSKGEQHATISYRKGEIISTVVDGSESEEALSEVMSWKEGRYKIVLPPLVLPAPPPRPVRPSLAETRTLFGYAPPPPPAHAPPRETLPFVPPVDYAASARRATRPGMPVDVYDTASPERTTDVGVPAFPSPSTSSRPSTTIDIEAGTPGPLPTTLERPGSLPSAAAAAGPAAGEPRSTAPGFGPARPADAPAPAPAPAPSRETRPPAATVRMQRRVAVRRRTLSDLPVAVHVGLGLALGLAIVGAYWVVQGLLLQ